MAVAPGYRGICNQRLHWAKQCIERSGGDDGDGDGSGDGVLRDSALLQLQIAYAAHLADLMALRDGVWQGEVRATEIRLSAPEIEELQNLERDANWIQPLFWLQPGAVVAALGKGAEPALLASDSVDYKAINNNTIRHLCTKLDELILRQRDQLQEY